MLFVYSVELDAVVDFEGLERFVALSGDESDLRVLLIEILLQPLEVALRVLDLLLEAVDVDL